MVVSIRRKNQRGGNASCQLSVAHVSCVKLRQYGKYGVSRVSQDCEFFPAPAARPPPTQISIQLNETGRNWLEGAIEDNDIYTAMASGASFRPVLSSCTQCLQPYLWRKALTQSVSRTFHQSSCANSSEAAVAEEQRPTATYALPRTKVYEYTRPQPRAPVRTRQTAREFKVNDNPATLDEMYMKLLGPQGVNILTSELKWQAVTHASFDHGRQPYNNKLAFLGTDPSEGGLCADELLHEIN